MKTKDIGDFYEEKAEAFLVKKGFLILEKNYRFRRNEIDLITKDNDVLVFVEVKFRKNNFFGNPEDFVDHKKLERLQEAAENYMLEQNWLGKIRFDVVAISKIGVEHFTDIS